MISGTLVSGLLQRFFLDRLLRERQVSPHTIASYRDTFRILLGFAWEKLGKAPTKLALPDLDAPFIGAFLDHLECHRGNKARTRNVRLAAVHSFFQYVALLDPAHGDLCRRVLAIPSKRFDRKPIDFLSPEEADALLNAPDLATWIGRRDRALLLVAVQTGLRCAELTGLRREDVVCSGEGAHVHCVGKGRKERCTPLRKEVRETLSAWLAENQGLPADPLFPTIRGRRMSSYALQKTVKRHTQTAARTAPTLRRKRVSPHTLRHTAAMDLLQGGVDRSVIALWLGHEQVETTQMYLHADIRMKERALSRTTDKKVKTRRFKPDDELLDFLEGL